MWILDGWLHELKRKIARGVVLFVAVFIILLVSL